MADDTASPGRPIVPPQAQFRFHEMRDQLVAEAHARPPTPLPHPTLAARLANLSGEGGGSEDWAHMVALCRKLQAPEPSEGARWSVLDAGKWRLRWERHTEISTWTFYRPIPNGQAASPGETALDLTPKDWLSAIPGDVLVASHVELTRSTDERERLIDQDDVAVNVLGGAAQVSTDFRAGADSFTRFHIVQKEPDAGVAGRLVQLLFEIETYRLLALLGFPVATQTATTLSRLEAQAADAAMQVANEGDIGDDRALLDRLAALAGEAQALAGRTNFRFAAAKAYYGLVEERIGQLRETRIDARPTIDEFMERRLAPAMRTCVAVSQRQQAVIQHIARTTQLLSTRVEVAAEITNANLLASMDRRAKLQLRLQETVESLSVAAISYYSVSLLSYGAKGLAEIWPAAKAEYVTALITPLVVLAVWLTLRRVRKSMLRDSHEAG